VPDSAVLKPKVLTAEAWIKGTGAAGVDRYILSKGAKGCAMASYAIYTGDGSGLTFYISNGESFVTSPDAGKRVWDNKWHHVAGTYDGRAVKLYLDGRQVAGNKPTTLAINYDLPTDNKFYIGHYGGCSLGFLGAVDDVRIWDRPLSPAEVQQRFKGY